jgi:hypothetical protein
MQSRRAFLGATLLIGAAACSISSACSSSETSVSGTAPTTVVRCQVSVSSSAPSPIPATGGSGALNVSTARDCTWSVATDSSWVSLTGARDGQGSGSVPFSVGANPAASQRSATITVGSESVPLSQAAAPCHFSLSRAADTAPAAGGRLTVDVSTLAGCAWSASSGASWIAIASGQSGNASGTVAMTVAANTGSARSGQVTIAGQPYKVSQAAPADSPAPTPTPQPTPAPPPPPPPPPAEPSKVHVEGVVLFVSGDCPDLTFLVGIRRIVTDRNTDFNKKNDCGDLRNGRSVAVDGLDQGNSVLATKIELKKDEEE